MTDRPDGCPDGAGYRCRCRAAVERCYHSLCRHGQPRRHALEAAIEVYRWHHPEMPAARAEEIVDLWVSREALH